MKCRFHPCRFDFQQSSPLSAKPKNPFGKSADALIEECGPPGNHGVNTGALDKLDQCGRELRRLGFETSREYLRDLRRTAANFPDGVRTPSVPFTVHLEAGDPASSESSDRSGDAGRR